MTREEAILRLKNVDIRDAEQEDYDALDMAIKALEQDPCEDAISRQQAIDKMQELEDEDIKAYSCKIPEGFDGKRAIEALKALQPVTPQQKVGKWISVENEEMETVGYYCSECDLPMETEYRTKFCPNCGAKMVEPQESEDKE